MENAIKVIKYDNNFTKMKWQHSTVLKNVNFIVRIRVDLQTW